MEDATADRNWEPIQVCTVLFALEETLLSDEVGGVGDEVLIVSLQILVGHPVNSADLLYKLTHITHGVSTIPAEMGIVGHDLSTELSKSGSRSMTYHKTGNILPGVALRASIAHSPLNDVFSIQTSMLSKLFNIIKEGIKTSGVRGKL